MLQNKQCALVEKVQEADTFHKQVSQQRNDDILWGELLDKSIAVAAAVDVQPTRPRQVAR